MKKIFDLHSHIVFGVDDGSENLEESLKILEEASSSGITAMVATPHYIKGSMDEKTNTIKEKFDHLKMQASEKNIPIELYLGHEVYVDFDILEDLENKRCNTINQSRYLLIELPFQNTIHHLKDLIFELKVKGYFPIIAHPERYLFVQEDQNRLKELIELGAFTQLNLSSLSGRYGRQVMKTAKKLVKKRLIHFVGSDVHHSKSRALALHKPMGYLKKNCTEKVYNKIMYENAQNAVENKDIDSLEMLGLKRKKKAFKRTGLALLVLLVLFGSAIYYGYKKVEAQFESAMIEQVRQMEAQDAAVKAALEKKEAEEKAARAEARKVAKEKREAVRNLERQAIESSKQLIDQKIKSQEAAANELLKAAASDAEREKVTQDNAAALAALEKEKLDAEAAAKKMEEEMAAEEARILAEEEAEEFKMEQARIEKENALKQAELKKKSELEAKYTDYQSDKAKAMDLALSKLNMEQINRLIAMASGGFSPKEKAEAKEMFYNNFTEEEQVWILEMYYTYYGSSI